VNVVVHKVGKRLEKGYKCPVYCGVDHTHIYWSKDEIKSNQESNLQTVDELYHCFRDPGKE
jgi:hypothetical protein